MVASNAVVVLVLVIVGCGAVNATVHDDVNNMAQERMAVRIFMMM